MTVRLDFSDLVRGFDGPPVLDGVSGSLESGEVLLVTGVNGAGKSTLLRCLAGLLRPEQGRVECRLDGRVLDVAERRRAVGFVAADLALYEPLTCRENLDLFARLRGVGGTAVPELLERLGVPPARPVGALSSGLLQRLRWAWALLHSPPLLLLDEPFQHLDGVGEAVARELLAEGLERGAAVVVASPTPLDLPSVSSRLDLS